MNNISSRRSIPGSWPSNTPWQPISDTFQINKILGVGASGHVEKVTDTSKGTVYARKHMAKPKGHNWDKFRSRVLDEFYSMQRVACRHVINVDFYQEDAGRAMEIYMTPVADGNLMDLLETCVDDSYPALQIQIIYSWFGCLLKALNFVHSKKVVHKDIKPPNILVKDNIIYLADFGLSRDFEGGASQSIGPFAGTFEYQAPEFVTNQPHGRATDIFSLGCVFSEMLTVVHRKDLDQFRELRRTPVPLALIEMHHIVYSFHKNLKQVKEWVGDLRGTDKDNILVDTIFGMLEVDTLTRTSTVQALKRLESQKELCCTCGL
jgi:serine/threonine protein kinase